MLPICKPDGPCIRVEIDGEERWGSRVGDEIVLSDGERIPEATASYLAPASPSKIIAVHLTYGSRVREYEARTPPEPSYFMKPPTTLNGHRKPVLMAKGARFLNYEGELAVVVGERMKGVPIESVLDYVGGYTCANDIGMHDFRHADRGAMLRVKGHDGFLPLGPELVPASEFDPTSYTLRTYLNGEVVQEATADDLLFTVAYQLADLCRLITLEPGDVILTGTPANSRPMKPGDVVEVEISGIGRLTQHDRGVGRRSRRARRADAGVGPDAARRARDPRGRGRADGRGGPRAVIRLHRLDHVCLQVADLDEASARWQIQFGLVERSRAGGRAFLACNDEPYCLELVEGDEPGHDHTAFELALECSLDDARAHFDDLGCRVGGA